MLVVNTGDSVFLVKHGRYTENTDLPSSFSTEKAPFIFFTILRTIISLPTDGHNLRNEIASAKTGRVDSSHLSLLFTVLFQLQISISA